MSEPENPPGNGDLTRKGKIKMAKKSFGYVVAFVLPVPKKNLAVYRKMAKQMCKVSMEHGAIDYVECAADGIKKGKSTSFPQSVKAKAGETVVFSWITYKSRTHSDQVMKKVMSDPRLSAMMNSEDMPFDGMRMFWGGFKPIVAS
jgi:uncharacterized protein YbaA (DUF1428 family)